MTVALARISSQYDRVLKVLNWISPEKHSVVLGLHMKKRFQDYCRISSFNPSLSAEEEAEALKAKEEAEALKAKEEAEALKAKEEAEALKAKEEAEALKAKEEAEALKAKE